MASLGSKTLTCRSALALGILLTTARSVGLAQQPEAAKGELKIEGTHIVRLVLERQDKHREEWSNLSGSISMPAGTYRVQQIELQGGYSYPALGVADLAQISISPDKPAILRAGGPLRPAVRTERQGRVLILNYELMGIGDEKYRPAVTPQNPPSFTIYKGDKAVISGQFEYG